MRKAYDMTETRVLDRTAELMLESARLADEIAARKQAQRQLRRYRDRYVNLYDFAPLGYLTLDEDGFVQEINLAGAKMLAADRDTLIGYPLFEFVARQFRTAFLEHVQQCVRARQEVTTEVGLISKDGRQLTVQLRSIPVEENDQDVAFCKTAVIDITERHRFEESLHQAEERLRLAISAAKMGTWQWDLAADILTGDERCKAMLGLPTAAELNREVLFTIIHPEDLSTVQERLAEAHANPGDYESEFRVVWQDGSIHWVYAKGRSKHDGQRACI